MHDQQLNEQQLDRAVGAVLASAAGDALGAPHEFRPPLPEDFALAMTGGGHFDWAPGEWTDDTSMAIPLLQAVARGDDLTQPSALDAVVRNWIDWARDAKDVGAQSRAVFADVGTPSAAEATAAAERFLARAGRAGGDGSLMRVGPVALGYLRDSAEEAYAAGCAQARLTHAERDAIEAAGIWTVAIRSTILDGAFSLREATAHAEDPTLWLARIDEAERSEPVAFRSNGWVVHAFQAAWSSIHGATTLTEAVERAVSVGDDTDTVAAIAGALAGARWGASGLPDAWLAPLHGWPGVRGEALRELAVAAVRG